MQELTLPEELTVYTVASCQEAILELLSAKEGISLDCSQLVKIDAAGIQLLLSLEKTTFREKFGLQLTDITPEVEEIIEAAGIQELLMGGQNNE